MILNIKPIRQKRDYCGPACIAMILQFYKKKGTQKTIGKRYSIDFEEGMTIGMLLEALYYGIKIRRITKRSYKNPNKIRYYLNKYKIPIILDTLTHYVLAIGFNKNNVFIIDPISGRKTKRSNKSKFWSNLTGFILCFKKEDKNA